MHAAGLPEVPAEIAGGGVPPRRPKPDRRDGINNRSERTTIGTTRERIALLGKDPQKGLRPQDRMRLVRPALKDLEKNRKRSKTRTDMGDRKEYTLDLFGKSCIPQA